MTSEAARRELLIAPILLDVVHYTQAQFRIEYPLIVTEQLKGCPNYYLHADHKLLVVEAKNADLARGFTQLAVKRSGGIKKRKNNPQNQAIKLGSFQQVRIIRTSSSFWKQRRSGCTTTSSNNSKRHKL